MIRRILTLTVAFLVVTTAFAGPAFADRRDVTTTIGVDENGVTIKIDAALTGGGRAVLKKDTQDTKDLKDGSRRVLAVPGVLEVLGLWYRLPSRSPWTSSIPAA